MNYFHPLRRWLRHTKRVSTGLRAAAIARAKIHKFCFSKTQKKSGDENSDKKPCCDDVVENSSFEAKRQMGQTVAVSHQAMGVDFRSTWNWEQNHWIFECQVHAPRWCFQRSRTIKIDCFWLQRFSKMVSTRLADNFQLKFNRMIGASLHFLRHWGTATLAACHSQSLNTRYCLGGN